MKFKRWVVLLLGCGGLFLVYFFQDYLDFYSILRGEVPDHLEYTSDFQNVNKVAFIVNKTLRYVINDLLAIAVIFGLFSEKKYTRFSFYVMLFGLLVLLPAYLSLYFIQPHGLSSLISHLHRIVLNPVLMMLLIPAFYYQRSTEHKRS